MAAELAALTGESKTEAVTKALEQRLKLVRQSVQCLVKRLDEIAKHCASLPVLNERAVDTLLYDERGLPGQ